MKTIQVNSVPGFRFRQEIGNGTHTVICDLDVTSGGTNAGLDPKDHTLGGLGACTAMTIKIVADANKWQLDGISVKITQTDKPNPADSKKKIYIIAEEIEVRANLTQLQLDKLKAAAKKCPVYLLMTEQKEVEATITQVSPAAPSTPSTTAPQTAPVKTESPSGSEPQKSMPSKGEISKRFGDSAQSYADSVGHAKGADLAIVVNMLNPRPHMVVLDVATGAGHTAVTVSPFVRKVVATDLTQPMIDQTKKLAAARGVPNLEAQVADVENLPFANASFDAVTVRIAPHHFLDIKKAMAEIARVLVAGGVFVMEDSCAPESARQDKFINDLEKLRDPTHVRSYTKNEWKRLLADAGLKVVRLRHYRKEHDVADWIERSGLPQAEQNKVWEAFANAPSWARKKFAITFKDGRALSYSDDKVILRAVKS